MKCFKDSDELQHCVFDVVTPIMQDAIVEAAKEVFQHLKDEPEMYSGVDVVENILENLKYHVVDVIWKK